MLSKLLQDIGARLDGWQNNITGVGTMRDKAQGTEFVSAYKLLDPQLSNMFHQDAIAKKIVLTRPRAMFRRGYELKLGEDDSAESDDTGNNAEQVEELCKAAKALGFNKRLFETLVWGRLYGGAVMILGVEDGAVNQRLPLNEQTVRNIKFLNVIDRRYIQPATFYADPLGPNFGMPETYFVTSAVGGPWSGSLATPLLQIHETRLIRFDGAMVDAQKRRELGGWSYSCLQDAYDALRAFIQTFQSTEHLVTDASQGVFKMAGLMKMIAGGQKDIVATRMAMVDMCRSVARAVLLDPDANESFERVATSFAGLPDLLDRYMQFLSAATGIPVTLLMGRSPAGMNATGDSDFRAFYDEIAADQSELLEEPILRFYKILGKTLNIDTTSLYVCFHKLWEPSDVERADVYSKVAAADVAYITAGVLLEDEVALSRFGKGEYSLGTEIDVEMRRKSLEQDVQFHSENDPNDPEKPAGAANALATQAVQEQAAGSTGAGYAEAKPKE